MPARDPGAQPERTGLAWRRTTLTFTVAVTLAVRGAVHRNGSAATWLPATLGVLVWLGFLALAHRRIRALAAARPGALGTPAALAAVGCTLALMIVGVVMVLW